MSQHFLSVRSLVLVLSAVCGFAPGGVPAQGGQPSLNDLSMEVAALQVFREFRLTRPQLEALRKFAKDTVPEPSAREAAKASSEFRRTLMDLRDALVADDDDERIEQLQEQLDDLREKEKPELDDSTEVTEEARRCAPQLLRLLSARQMACYLAVHAEEIPEPQERLLEALEKVRALDPKEWKAAREAVSDEVSRGVAGLDPDKVAQVNDKVVQLLIHARALKDEEFKTERPELEKTAREIVGNLTSLDVLRHVLAQDLAELLSNPRLVAAIDARLKK
jgi:hypothetical protein